MNNQHLKNHLFSWKAVNSNGRIEIGRSSASKKQDIENSLTQKGFTVLKIKKHYELIFFPWKNKIPTKDIQCFLKDLSKLLSANIHLTTCLSMLEKSTKSKTMKSLLSSVNKKIHSGKSLSASLSNFPQYFSPSTLSLMKAGEQSGNLTTMLNSIVSYQKKSEKIKQGIKKSTAYPIIIFFISVVITLLMMFFIIPQFTELFKTTNAELPTLTKAIILITDFTTKNFLYFLFGAFLLNIFLINLYKKYSKFQLITEHLIFKMPIIGKIIKQSVYASTFNTLGVLLKSGISISTALDLTKEIPSWIFFKNAFSQICSDINSGKSLESAIVSTNSFPENISNMVAIGEISGNLDEMLHNISIYYEENTDQIAHLFSQMIEPVIMIILSLIIGTIIIAMYLPIFKIGATI